MDELKRSSLTAGPMPKQFASAMAAEASILCLPLFSGRHLHGILSSIESLMAVCRMFSLIIRSCGWAPSQRSGTPQCKKSVDRER